MTTTDGQRLCLPISAFGESPDTSLSPMTSGRNRIPSQTSRKRKHAEYRDDTAPIGPTFDIQAHPSFLSPRAQQLIPRLLLPRSRLPLAYLDLVGDQKHQFSSELFSARIENLENQEEGWSTQPMVLIAQSTRDSRHYAVERVQNGIYALCKLGQWVTFELLARLQAGAMHSHLPQRVQIKEQIRRPSEEWWCSSAIRLDTEASSRTLRTEKALTSRLCLAKPVQRSAPSSSISDNIPEPVHLEQAEDVLECMVEEEKMKEPEEMHRTIKSQYQEALYASKTSLAYFAKGPLSRARAAFQKNDGSGYDQSHLVQSLRTSILSLTVMDTKYRETLPALIKDLPFGPLSEDERATVVATLGKKVRKSKKTKVGKNGLYPGEEVSITRWWLARDKPSAACDFFDAREEETRAVLLEQRARETEMQIILALEVLALEAPSVTLSIEQNAQELLAQRDEESPKKKKPKKLLDLYMFLDLLVDRLCIWQSTSTDEDKASSQGKKSTPHYVAGAVDESTMSGHLRQFCVDVVLPFYAARLPDLTTLLCQKLGGLKQASPIRPTLMTLVSSQVPQKQGTAVPRVPARRPRRTLERVLTDERSASQKPPPSLPRSATDSVLPQMKREVSDTSLSSIPLNRVAMHKRYSQREVDLHATSQAMDAKLKKKAKIDQELQSAIAALKKPNPRMAVRELVEDAEKRVAGLHPRKSKHPVRNSFGQGVQIMATPSKNRKRNPFGAIARLSQPSASAPPEDLEDIAPSSVSRIPSSTNKAPFTLAKSTAQRSSDRFLPGIAQTPTRGFSKFSMLPNTSSAVITSATKVPQFSPPKPGSEPFSVSSGILVSHRPYMRNTEVRETPTKGRTINHIGRAQKSGVEATPIKVQSNDKPLNDILPADLPSSWEQEAETSIYASLGWDDDIDELS
ncbi:hypothetical protein N7G274_003831 [Stereocaulon virgatum]|uniref:DNA replication regulator Sld3 C-terminal domain-containing protein n=1 Tax=Stereocaulon virgatum TaxID=373712 RepID=A0ABR4ADG6_9LECA